MDSQNLTEKKMDRKTWMGILGGADPDDLQSAREKLGTAVMYNFIVRPETGMLMVQAKADGSSARFNLGEVSVSKCILEVNGQYLGAAWTMGSDLRHAELAALFDGLLQDPEYHTSLYITLIPVLIEKQRAQNKALAKDAQDTTVEFFTLKRGE